MQQQLDDQALQHEEEAVRLHAEINHFQQRRKRDDEYLVRRCASRPETVACDLAVPVHEHAQRYGRDSVPVMRAAYERHRSERMQARAARDREAVVEDLADIDE